MMTVDQTQTDLEELRLAGTPTDLAGWLALGGRVALEAQVRCRSEESMYPQTTWVGSE